MSGLSVIVLKTADQQARLLRVLAPLGVLLPNGLGLNIDGQDMGRVAFVRCLPNGCVAEVVLDDDADRQAILRHQRHFRGVQDSRGRHRHSGVAQGLSATGSPSCPDEAPSMTEERRSVPRRRTLKGAQHRRQ